MNLNGFASTSQDKNLALKFTFPSADKIVKGTLPVLIKIDIELKNGFPFACLFVLGEDYSVFKEEKEVLFNDGCNFDVVSIEECNDNPKLPSYTLIVLKTSSGYLAA